MKKITEADLILLWHLGYYDGYLSAIGLYNGDYVLISCIEENPEYYLYFDDDEIDVWFRKYFVYALNDEQIKIEIQRHRDFEALVGTHTNYVNNKRVGGFLQPQDQWPQFYTKYQNLKIDYSNNEVVAYYLK